MSYEIVQAQDEFTKDCIKWVMEDETIAFIPIDPANSDYQRYLETLKK
jgi:hypothetical protein